MYFAHCMTQRTTPFVSYKFKYVGIIEVSIKFHSLDSAAICAKGKKFYGKVVCVDCFRTICSKSSFCYVVKGKSRSWQVMPEQKEEAVIKRLMVARKGSKEGKQIGGKKIEGCYKGT
jgi:hypothetical protein